MLRILVVSTALLTGVSACATAPTYVDVKSTDTIALPFDQTWDNVVRFFATNDIAIRNIDKDSGLLVAERQYGDVLSPRARSSAFYGWASCGTPGFPEVASSREVSLNVLARPSGQSTSVTVTARFSELRTAGEFGSRTVDCNSTGVLEALVLEKAAGR